MKRSNIISVPLSPTDEDKEAYRNADENFIKVQIQLPDGSLYQDGTHRVIVTLSKDAMFGLGSALLRASKDLDQIRGCWEMVPATENDAVENLGVYLHPESCQLIVNLESQGTLAGALERSVRNRDQAT